MPRRAHLRTHTNSGERKVQDPDELWAVYSRAGGRLTADSQDEEAPQISKRRQRMKWSCEPPCCVCVQRA